ncbi:reverse transcriptase-like protein [Fictibacillus aquaticus]|uniref:reverse transcriptase-like protein n=1 Tax=Fictibacillus aquaticus TaxID=2021314 RepID=UPI0013FDCF8A|nr:reverse transcriptase-like protein [Fictibacillus aquaticus]
MELKIVWRYKYPKNTETIIFSSSGFMPVKTALAVGNDLEKTGRAASIEYIDEYETSWSIKEIKKWLKEKETEPEHVTAYFDGGFQESGCLSGQGILIYFKQNGSAYRLRKNAAMAEMTSNNESEYAALWLLADELEQMGVRDEKVNIKGDSKVVIYQMSGEWPCYESEHQYWADKIDAIFKRCSIRPQYTWVQRSENKDADSLALQAIEGKLIKAVKELID